MMLTEKGEQGGGSYFCVGKGDNELHYSIPMKWECPAWCLLLAQQPCSLSSPCRSFSGVLLRNGTADSCPWITRMLGAQMLCRCFSRVLHLVLPAYVCEGPFLPILITGLAKVCPCDRCKRCPSVVLRLFIYLFISSKIVSSYVS